MRVHLVNPSDVSFGMAIITPRWLYVLAAATPPMWGNPVLTDETLEVFDPAQVDVVGIGIHKPTLCAATRLAGSHASKGYTLSTAVFTRHSTQTRPTSWAERTPSSVVMGIRVGHAGRGVRPGGTRASLRGRARRGDWFAAGPVEPHAARSLYVGIGADSSRLSETLLVLLRVAHRWSGAASTNS